MSAGVVAAAGVLSAAQPYRKAERLAALDGLRVAAALLPFGRHFCELFSFLLPNGSWHAAWAQLGESSGAFGTNLLLIISGLLVYRSVINQGASARSLLTRRLVRIYPVFLIVLGLTLAFWLLGLPLASFARQLSEWPLRRTLVSLPLLAGVLPVQSILVPAWTLSHILLFCLLMPALARWLRLRERPVQQRLILLAALAALWITLWSGAWSLLPDSTVHPGLRERQLRFVWVFAGALVAEILALRHWQRWCSRRTEVMVLLLLAAALPLQMQLLSGLPNLPWLPGYGSFPHFYRLVLAVSVLVPLSLVALGHQGWLQRVLAAPAITCWGQLSLTFYLSHFLVLDLLRTGLRAWSGEQTSPLLFWFLLPVCLMVCAGVAYALQRSVAGRLSHTA